PALAAAGGGGEAVVGVASHGDAACQQGATYTRVDAVLASFLQPTLSGLAEGSAATGARCLYPDQCAGGASACVVASDDPALSYCTAPCGHDTDCPGAMTCAAGSCLYPAPTPGAYGAPCAGPADCVEGECTTTGVCALRCVPTEPACPDGYACTRTADVDYFCIASPAPARGGGCALAAVAGRTGAEGLPWIAAGAIALRLARRRGRRR
ncbi:MAG: hypothetical protein ACRELB_27600, partial [Polyangiaceae bacterium]